MGDSGEEIKEVGFLVAAKYQNIHLGPRELRRQKSETRPFDPLVSTAPGFGSFLME